MYYALVLPGSFPVFCGGEVFMGSFAGLPIDSPLLLMAITGYNYRTPSFMCQSEIVK